MEKVNSSLLPDLLSSSTPKNSETPSWRLGLMCLKCILARASLRLWEKKKKKQFRTTCSLLTALHFPVFGIKLFPSRGLYRLFVAPGRRGDSFHKTFMRSACLFAWMAVSVWVLTLTKGLYWFLHWFPTVLSSFSPSLAVANILWREEGTSRLPPTHNSVH